PGISAFTRVFDALWGEGGGEGVTGAPSRDVTPSPHPSPSGRGSRARRARRWCLGFNGPYSIALVVLALLIFPVLALDFPTLTGRVVDEATVLDPATQATLTDKLAALEAKTTDQLVVVTLKSLQGTSIEDFGVQLGRRWQIGQKGKNNGVLLIVAPNE